MDRYRQQLAYEAEGAAAAAEGKVREDCPYTDQASDAWNFWVYGNENAQWELIRQFMDAEGVPRFYTTTEASLENYEAIRKWSEIASQSEKRMRQARGWSEKAAKS